MQLPELHDAKRLRNRDKAAADQPTSGGSRIDYRAPSSGFTVWRCNAISKRGATICRERADDSSRLQVLPLDQHYEDASYIKTLNQAGTRAFASISAATENPTGPSGVGSPSGAIWLRR